MSHYIELTEENFESTIKKGVALVDFLGAMVWSL